MAEKKNRIRNLSTRWLAPFKVIVYILYILLSGAITFSFATRGNNVIAILLGLAQASLFIYFFYRLLLLTSKIYRIEFDDQFLYVLKKDQDLVIPLENIKSVEISTLGGVYKVNLYHREQFGDHFYFKLSLWYPLNFKSKDELVNILRSKIEKAKLTPQTAQSNSLMS